MVEIRFLGSIRFICDGCDGMEKIGSKTAALVALLMLQKKMVRREWVIGYLWPDSSEEAAKYNLRYNLWQLKKAIGPDEKGELFLNIEKDCCGINFRYNFRCDVLEVLGFDPAKENSVEKLASLRDLYAGEFFEGHYFNGCDDFNELIIFHRNILENCRVNMLRRLAALYEKEEDYAPCLETLTEILRLEPYDEDTALKAMSVYAACGKRVEAIRYYKTFCSKLICNLGIQPSEELKKKYNEIKATGARMNEKAVELETWCMKDVEFFWISEVIEAIIKSGAMEDKNILNRVEIADLATIAPRIAFFCGIEREPSGYVPEVRIVRGFLHLIENVCIRRSLCLKIRRASDMDQCSGRVFQYLKDKHIEGLEIQMELS